MRTPNSKCCICGKPLYRRPGELKSVRHVACMEHRAEAQRVYGQTDKQRAALDMGRAVGMKKTKYKHRAESNRKASISIKAWCAENKDKVKARGKKTRGKRHYNWKGGCSKLKMAVRRLTENRRWVDAVVRRDKVCSDCGSLLDLEAHHIIGLSVLVEKRWQGCQDLPGVWVGLLCKTIRGEHPQKLFKEVPG